MFLLALQKVGTPGVFTICRPNTGTSFFDMEVMSPPTTCRLFLQQSLVVQQASLVLCLGAPFAPSARTWL